MNSALKLDKYCTYRVKAKVHDFFLLLTTFFKRLCNVNEDFRALCHDCLRTTN